MSKVLRNNWAYLQWLVKDKVKLLGMSLTKCGTNLIIGRQFPLQAGKEVVFIKVEVQAISSYNMHVFQFSRSLLSDLNNVAKLPVGLSTV